MPDKSGLSIFFRQSGVYVLGGILQRSVGFLLLPLYTSFLTPEDYGIVGLISVSISLLVPLAVMGISSSLMIEYYHSDTEERKRTIISTAIIASFVISSIISVILFLSARPISNILFSTTKWTYAVQLASISFFLSGISSVGFSFLRTIQQPIRFRSLSIASAIAAGLLNVLFIAFLHHGVVGFFEASVISGILQASMLTIWSIKYASHIRVNKAIVLSLLKLGWPEIPIRLAGWALTSANRYFIAIFASLAEVGIFSLAFRMASIMELLFISIIRFAFAPYILSRMKDENFSAIYKRLVSYIMMIGIFIAILLSATSKELIMLMARNRDFWPAYKSVGILNLSFLLYGLYLSYGVTLGILKKPALEIPVLITAAIVNAGLNYLLVPLWGAVGSAAAFLIAYILSTIQIHFAISRHYRLAMPWLTLIRIFLAGVISFAITALFPNWHPIIKLFMKTIFILISFPCLLSLLGAIDDTERKAINGRVRKYKFFGKAVATLLSLDLRKTF